MNQHTLPLLATAILLLGSLTGCNPPADNGPSSTTMNSTSSTMTSASPAMAGSPAATVSTTTSGSPEAASGSPEVASTGAPSGTTTLDASEGTTVKILLSDTSLQMPSALPAGAISFVVNNTGKNKHNLEIKGAGVDQKLDAPLNPGASQALKVDLKAGKYAVTDPDNATIKSELTIK